MNAGLFFRWIILGLAWPMAAANMAHADEPRPAPDAKLLIMRYASSGSSVLFGYSGPPLPDIAIFSDGTILAYDEAGRLTQTIRVTTIPANIATARYAQFYQGLASASPAYPHTCWHASSDGSEQVARCIDDASTANIVLKLPGVDQYKAIAVNAGYHWRSLQGMRDFAPPVYFDLMAWIDGLQSLPSQPWRVPDDGIPGLTASGPVCAAAAGFCK